MMVECGGVLVDSEETLALGKTGRRREQLLRQDGAPPLVLLLNRLVVKALPANQRVRYSLPREILYW